MRSALLIAGTFVALCLAFFVYTRIAAPPAALPAGENSNPAATAESLSETQLLGKGKGAWVNLYDKSTGELYARLRAAQYDPLPNSRTYHLTRPEADFYQKGGQIVHLLAVDGNVEMGDADSQRALAGNTPLNPPGRGVLRDVLISLYPGPAAQQRGEADLVAHLDNIGFDMDMCRLFTADEKNAAGQTIPADQVPVTVRGKDVEFDGQGLELDWNDTVHDLKSLVVRHGQRLRLMNAKTAESNSSGSSSAAASSSSAPRKARPARLYLATFASNVRVSQDGQDKVRADEMDVTLARKPEDKEPAAGATTNAPHAQNPTHAAAQSPADVFWSGPLVVVPVDNADASIKPGSEAVHFVGSPVHIHNDNLDLVGGDARYQTGDGSAQMTGVNGQPVDMTFFNNNHQRAGTAQAEQVSYLSQQRAAILSGVGNADFAAPEKSNSIGDSLRTAWTKECDVFLSGTGKQSQIERAVLVGDGAVHDLGADGREKLRLTAQKITADFDKPPGAKSNTPEVSRVVAAGDANCVIHDLKTHGPDQTLSTDLLTIETARSSTGELYPKFITADGHVHGTKDQEELWSRKLLATVAPVAGKPSKGSMDESKYDLSNLLATGDVRAKGKDGDSASGDVLSVEEQGGKQVTTLAGSPAIVTGEKGILRGPRIELRPHEHLADIAGPGTIDATTASAAGKKPRPVHVSWLDSAHLDGSANLFDVRGGVEANSTESGGTTDIAKGDRALVALADAPEKKKKEPKSQPIEQMDLMGQKQVKEVSLLNHAEMQSETVSPAGALLKRETILGDRIDAYPQTKRLVVPGPGRMLLEDYSRPTTRPVNRQGTQGGHGETSFQWHKQFTFDQTTQQAIFDGPVTIVHWPDLTGKKGTTLLADRVTADFEPDTGNGAKAVSEEEPIKLKQVIAAGNINVMTSTATVDADQVIYDPVTGLLDATGTPDNPVHVTDDRNRGQASFDEVWIDMQTNEIKRMIGFTGQVKQ